MQRTVRCRSRRIENVFLLRTNSALKSWSTDNVDDVRLGWNSTRRFRSSLGDALNSSLNKSFDTKNLKEKKREEDPSRRNQVSNSNKQMKFNLSDRRRSERERKKQTIQVQSLVFAGQMRKKQMFSNVRSDNLNSATLVFLRHDKLSIDVIFSLDFRLTNVQRPLRRTNGKRKTHLRSSPLRSLSFAVRRIFK